jgi:ABC-2 type transport system permease protein
MKLYLKYISIHMKSIMQYKMSFFLTSLGQFLVSFNVFLGVYFMFLLVPKIKGYTFLDVLLCFSIILMQFALAECFARGFDGFSSIISNGEFDRIMVRPRNEILQVLGSRFEFTRIGRMTQAIIMFVYGIYKSDLDWNYSKIITIVFMIIGGMAVFCGLFLIYAALCFYTIQGLEFMNIFTDGAREFGKFPVNVYGKGVLLFCTYVIPFALFQYYPLLYLLDKTSNKVNIFLPLASVLFLLPCIILWKIGLKHYKSTGS